MSRVDPYDPVALNKLRSRLPEGWEIGPTHCPIGLDRAPFICSAGYCLACRWIAGHWLEKPVVELLAPEVSQP